jgi:5-methylcytosine-specific restriction endonuclease McrA
MIDRHVLLLNQNYEPLTVCRARRALVLMLSRKADMLETDTAACRTVRFAFRLPSVLRLNYYVHVKRRDVPLTKRNVLRRDGGVCQYCGRRGAVMTTDHVIPRALSGPDTWENLVCACSECNSRKGHLTPTQARMTLRRKPKKPHYFTFALNSLGNVPDPWRQYLFMS